MKTYIVVLFLIVSLTHTVLTQTVMAETVGGQTEFSECPTGQVGLMTRMVKEFYLLTNETLLSANFNSEILPFLFSEYRKVVLNLTQMQVSYAQQEGVNSDACRILSKKYINEARVVFKETYTRVGQRKQNFLLYEKLDAINLKLNQTADNLIVVERSLSKINSFLPCLVKKCIKR